MTNHEKSRNRATIIRVIALLLFSMVVIAACQDKPAGLTSSGVGQLQLSFTSQDDVNEVYLQIFLGKDTNGPRVEERTLPAGEQVVLLEGLDTANYWVEIQAVDSGDTMLYYGEAGIDLIGDTVNMLTVLLNQAATDSTGNAPPKINAVSIEGRAVPANHLDPTANPDLYVAAPEKDEPITFVVTATDWNVDPLTIIWAVKDSPEQSGTNVGTVIGSNIGNQFTWMHDTEGRYFVHLSVADDQGGSAAFVFPVYVWQGEGDLEVTFAFNTFPSIAIEGTMTESNMADFSDSLINLQADVFDPDGDAIVSTSWSIDCTDAYISTDTSLLDIVITPVAAEICTATVEVCDSLGCNQAGYRMTINCAPIRVPSGGGQPTLPINRCSLEGVCVPEPLLSQCATEGYECGTAFDSCAVDMQCGPLDGACPVATDTCIANMCVACEDLRTDPEVCGSSNCGMVQDNCLIDRNCGNPTCGGAPNMACTDNTCVCTAADTCGSMGYNCGTFVDDCGNTIDCGDAACGGVLDTTCTNNVCVCDDLRTDLQICSDAGANCGTVLDNCGNVVDCGDITCGGAPNMACTDNVCTCTPADTCATMGNECGTFADDCGVVQDCGTPDCCREGANCTNTVCTANTCECTPVETCASMGYDCETFVDDCGAVQDCGTCPSPTDTCVANVCENCDDARTDGEVCGSAECGIVQDNCLVVRDCGDCPITTDSCVANACEACDDSRTDLEVCGSFNCGTVQDTCFTDRNCGTCSGTDTCESNVCTTCSDTRLDAEVCGAMVCGTMADNCLTDRTCGTGTCPAEHMCAVDQLSCDPLGYHCRYVDNIDFTIDMCTEYPLLGDNQAAAQAACAAILIDDLYDPGDMDNSGGISAGDRVLAAGYCPTYLASAGADTDLAGSCDVPGGSVTWQENVQGYFKDDCDNGVTGSSAADCELIGGTFTCDLCIPVGDVCADNNYDCSTVLDPECPLDPEVDCGPVDCGSVIDTSCVNNVCTCDDTRTDLEICSAAGADCDTVLDNCGNTIDCGPVDCGGAANMSCQSNVCVCTPANTCGTMGYDCETFVDDCGDTIDCGAADCGGAANMACVSNVCECTPANTCGTMGYDCETFVDDCGDTIDCGAADCGGAANMACVSNVCECTPANTCGTMGYDCETFVDDCGDTIDCGAADCGGAANMA
ncbi:MAG: hypothetical protein GY762_11430, partial [Proteobacteria bacterium]|nr:hypothetical protein [Pseudomonadota bacterium]